jgi:hypothetical protein
MDVGILYLITNILFLFDNGYDLLSNMSNIIYLDDLRIRKRPIFASKLQKIKHSRTQNYRKLHRLTSPDRL